MNTFQGDRLPFGQGNPRQKEAHQLVGVGFFGNHTQVFPLSVAFSGLSRLLRSCSILPGESLPQCRGWGGEVVSRAEAQRLCNLSVLGILLVLFGLA